MLDFLDRLRSKPEYVRKRIAFLVSTSLSLFIFSIAWTAWTQDREVIKEVKPPSPLSLVNDKASAVTSEVYDMWHTTISGLEYDAKKANDSQTAATIFSNESSPLLEEKPVYPEEVFPNQ